MTCIKKRTSNLKLLILTNCKVDDIAVLAPFSTLLLIIFKKFQKYSVHQIACYFYVVFNYFRTTCPNKELQHNGSATWPEYPKRGCQGESCWLNLRECGPEVDQGPGVKITSPNLAWPRHILCEGWRSIRCCWKLWDFAPRRTRDKKRVWTV